MEHDTYICARECSSLRACHIVARCASKVYLLTRFFVLVLSALFSKEEKAFYIRDWQRVRLNTMDIYACNEIIFFSLRRNFIAKILNPKKIFLGIFSKMHLEKLSLKAIPRLARVKSQSMSKREMECVKIGSMGLIFFHMK